MTLGTSLFVLMVSTYIFDYVVYYIIIFPGKEADCYDFTWKVKVMMLACIEFVVVNMAAVQ